MADTLTTGSGALGPDIQKRLLDLEQAIQQMEDQFKISPPVPHEYQEVRVLPISHRNPDWLKLATKISVISLAVATCLLVTMFVVQSGIGGLGGLDQLVEQLEVNTLFQPWV